MIFLDQIQLRRGTAALWTSSNPTLAPGELGLETDTNKLKIGDGSTAWASLSYFDIANGLVSPVTAAHGGTGQSSFTKGDLLVATGSTAIAKLPVGTDAQVLTADSTQTDGIKWGTLAITAGAGLTETGSLGTGLTLDVGAGTGITVNADDIQIAAAYQGANPTATVGLTVANGSATSYMRSDGAPALSQAIIPTWTGLHTFNAAAIIAKPASGTALTVGDTTGGVTNAVMGRLTVAVGQNFLANSPEIFPTTGTDTLTLGTWGAGPVQIYTTAILRLTIGSAGNVTIAAPTSGTALTVSSSSAGDDTARFIADGNARSAIFNCINDSFGVSIEFQRRGVNTGYLGSPAFSTSGNSTDLVLVAANTLLLGAGGVNAIKITGATTTGAQIATFSATNKPGTGTAGPISWLPVQTAAGTVGYIPLFGA